MGIHIKRIIALGLLAVTLMGCGKKVNSIESDKESDASMFVVLEVGSDYVIAYHQKTKVMYAISNGVSNRGTFTVMLDADGKPMLYKEGE